MADEFDFDDDEFGSDEFDDMDFGDGGFDMDPMKDDRKPVVKVTSAAMEELRSREGRNNALKKAAYTNLPKGYKSTVDEALDVKDMAGDLYDKAMDDLEPTKQQLKKVGRKALPMARKFLPKSVSDKLESLTEKESRSSAVDADKMAIENSLTSIFEVQQVQEAQKTEGEKQEKAADLELEGEKFKISSSQMERVAKATEVQSDYVKQIMGKYHRKMLELTHLNYFANRDILAQIKAQNTDHGSLLQSISKNTALPNEQKVLASETFSRMNREEILGYAQQSVIDRLGGVREKIRKSAATKIADLTGMINSTAEQIGGMIPEDGEDAMPGMDPLSMLGSMAVGAMRDKLFDSIMKKVKERAMSDPNSDISLTNKRLELATRDMDALMLDIVNNPEKWGDKGDGALQKMVMKTISAAGKVANWTTDGGITINPDSETVNNKLSDTMLNPTSWDQGSRRTLNEVIPYYLSKISQYTGMTATGSSMEREVFDMDKERMVSHSEALANLDRRIRKDTSSDQLGTTASNIVNKIDPNSVLSADATLALKQAIVKNSASTKTFNPEDYATAKKLDGGPIAEEVATFIRDRFQLLDSGRRSKMGGTAQDINISEEILDDYMGIRNQYGSMDNVINEYYASGNSQLLFDSDIIQSQIDGKNKVNINKKWEMITDRLTGADTKATEGDSPSVSNNSLVSGLAKLGGSEVDGKVLAQTIASGSDRTSIRLDKSNDLLRIIADKIDSPTSAGNPEGTTSPFGDKLLEAQNTTNEKLDRLIEGVDGLTMVNISDIDLDRIKSKGSNLLGKVTSGLGAGVGKMWEFQKWSIKQAREISGGAMGMVGSTLGSIKEKLSGNPYILKIKDGGLISEFSVKKMKAGKYIDSVTGDVLTSLEEIKAAKGDIIDSTTQSVIIRLEDLKAGIEAIDIRDKGKGLIGTITSTVGKIGGMYTDMAGTAISLIKNSGNMVRSLIVRPQDVYVKGETEARLLAWKFAKGHYFDKSGKVVGNHTDISGEVYDSDGNLVLNSIEAADLVDASGERLKDITLSGKAKRLASYTADKVVASVKYLKDLQKRGLSKGKEALTYIKDKVKGVKGSISVMGSFSQMDRLIAVTEAIYAKMGGDPSSVKEGKRPNAPEDDGAKKPKSKDYSDAYDNYEDVASGKMGKGATEEQKQTSILKSLLTKMRIDNPTNSDDEALRSDAGMRKGGWREKLAGLKDKVPGMGAIGGLGAGLFSRVKGLKDKLKNPFKRKDKGGEPDEGGIENDADDSVMDDALGWASGLAGGYLGAKVLGAKDKVAGMFGIGKKGKEAKAAAKATKAAKKADKVAKATKAAKTAKNAATAAKAAKTAKNVSTTGKALKAATMVARVGTLGLKLSNPVGWAILGAELTYAGYKTYKYFEARAEPEAIERLRFGYYGLDLSPGNEIPEIKDKLTAIRKLEANIAGSSKMTSPGRLTTEGDSLEYWYEHHEDFGFTDPEDPMKEQWIEWFHNRFIPVFGVFAVAMTSKAIGMDIKDVLDVDDELEGSPMKTKFLLENVRRAVRSQVGSGSIFNRMGSPFSDGYMGNTDGYCQTLERQLMESIKSGEERLNLKAADKAFTESKEQAAKEEAARRAQHKKDVATGKAKGPYRPVRKPTPKEIMGASFDSARRKRMIAEMQLGIADNESDTTLMLPAAGLVSSPFGTRTHPISGGKKMHKGVDIAAPEGTPIYAAASGTVLIASYVKGYGNCVYLNHTDGKSTRYAHMSAFAEGIKPGSMVTIGDLLGYVGNTGNSTGPHLHFEYRDGKGASNDLSVLNPVPFFDEDIGKQIRKEELIAKREAKGIDKNDATDTPIVHDKTGKPKNKEEIAVNKSERRSRVTPPKVASNNAIKVDNSGVEKKLDQTAKVAQHQGNEQIELMRQLVAGNQLLAEVLSGNSEESARKLEEYKKAMLAQQNRNNPKQINMPVDMG